MDTLFRQLLKRHGGFVTRRQVDESGIEPHVLTRWVREGRLERIQHGVYRSMKALPSEHEDLLEVALRIPYAVICLRSALAFYGLTTYIPKAVDIAVPQKSKPPKLAYPPLQVHYFGKTAYGYGLAEVELHGHKIKIYSLEKTLVDLLRFSHVYGDDLFAEGLKNYLEGRKHKVDLHGLLEAAQALRVDKKLRPLLRVLAYDLST
ncbi:MAG: type IV toxin-antitoxin system AbiEi family antitoxin domain-containing protein [Meiothermus sp.]|nr:type IV toxin-antitoxin system AbiEi family antitoxin domain-containing protein [Meiothermus sp.]